MEERNWRPSKWTPIAVERKLKRIFRCALDDLCYIMGPHAARLAYAEIKTKLDGELSRSQLHSMGVKLIGDGHS